MTVWNFRTTVSAAACVAALGLGFAGPVAADDGWKPTGPVSFVMHTKPGGGTDVMVRALAHSLEPMIGQTLVVENAPGGGGATQMAKVRAAKPDGLTLGVNTVSHFTAFLTNLDGVFSADDFAWIALMQVDPILVFSEKDSAVTSITDLVELARSKPGQVNIGGFGPVGSMQHLGMTMLEQEAGVVFNWVAFESTPDIIAAVMGGHVDAGVANLGPVIEFFEADRLKGIGVLGDDRLSSVPDMQTFGEQGYNVDTSWLQVRGVFGPKDIDPALQQQIADAIFTAMEADTYQTYARSAGVEDGTHGPAEYTAFVERILTIAEAQLKAANLLSQ
ncbi:Bug family tripartite tricarboxylate transporter substrate binding protein [Pseudotabrizicola alkalilacus]|uniref:Tripartite tricarboxylate transporter substrate binding protein n=1 Tax=Pseudotabrizicola alkalilacus TaxID=2305252 RepID=A0A411Z4M8_9RHOB|nr:tripartite tricarboxylate transporter substrate binding protein [Pseudotabrizicola alkalilacus]RGP38023.1 tripartite tricarboxylate transporter substrate binding protein [Pseudotabrizicola alkalilacus]